MEGSQKRSGLTVHVGNKTEFELASVVSDLKGADPEELKSVLEQDAVEMRLNTVKEFRLTPFADARDFSEWDRDVLLSAWPPLYGSTGEAGDEGSCGLERSLVGARELKGEERGARLSLVETCKGCLSQMATARQLLDYALSTFGPETPVALGKNMDSSDFTWAGAMCGFQNKTLHDLSRALSYAESQLARAWFGAVGGRASVVDMESHSFHAGTMLLLAQEVIETLKASLFGFSAAANIGLADIPWYPTPIWTGRGAMEPGKKSVVFVGDNFVPMWLLVEKLRKAAATERFEICGIGQAADDLPRFYERARWVGPMVRARKVLRTGAFDIIVGSEGCLSFDLATEAGRTRSALVWTGFSSIDGLPDRSQEEAGRIAADLLAGSGAVWIKDPDKAAEVVILLLHSPVARRGGYVMDEATARREAARCGDDCDLCSYACPNGIQVSRGVRAVRDGQGLKALNEMEKNCCLFAECDRACPEKVPISDMMVAAFAGKAAQDRFLFRGGRGGGQRAEMAANDFTASPGNSPGWFGVIGCGRSNPEDVQWIANELACRNGIVVLAGCAVGDVAHLYDAQEGKWFMQRYPFWLQPRSAGNLGGCSACQFVPLVTLKNARSGAGVTHYANYVETVATTFDRYACNTIVWGPLPERMYSIVAGFVRSGVAVIVGPVSGLDWTRLMPGDKWDWQRYWAYETLSGRRRTVEPSPKHMLFPVETKEEAVVMASCLSVKPAQGFRMSFLEGYLDTHQQYFKELPDDWNRYVRSPGDLPIAARARLIKELVDRHGWKVEGMGVKELPLPSGRLVDQKQFIKEYGAGGAPITRVPRLGIKPLHARKA